MRICRQPVCQPEAINSPVKPAFAFSGSTCMSCASNSDAKAMMSSALTATSP